MGQIFEKVNIMERCKWNVLRLPPNHFVCGWHLKPHLTPITFMEYMPLSYFNSFIYLYTENLNFWIIHFPSSWTLIWQKSVQIFTRVLVWREGRKEFIVGYFSLFQRLKMYSRSCLQDIPEVKRTTHAKYFVYDNTYFNVHEFFFFWRQCMTRKIMKCL